MYFKEQQKAVCIKTHSQGIVTKGEIKTVSGIDQCACGDVVLSFEELRIGAIVHTSCDCGHVMVGAWVSSKLFSPLLDNFADNVLAEIKEQAEEEFFQPITK